MLVGMPTTMWMTHPSVVMLRLSDGVLRVILVALGRLVPVIKVYQTPTGNCRNYERKTLAKELRTAKCFCNLAENAGNEEFRHIYQKFTWTLSYQSCKWKRSIKRKFRELNHALF